VYYIKKTINSESHTLCYYSFAFLNNPCPVFPSDGPIQVWNALFGTPELDICITTTSSSGIPIDKFNEIVSEENIITKYQKIFW
jgi:hypothetical protein